MRLLRWFGLAPRLRAAGARVIDMGAAIIELDVDTSQFTTILMLPHLHVWSEDDFFPRHVAGLCGDWAWVG